MLYLSALAQVEVTSALRRAAHDEGQQGPLVEALLAALTRRKEKPGSVAVGTRLALGRWAKEDGILVWRDTSRQKGERKEGNQMARHAQTNPPPADPGTPGPPLGPMTYEQFLDWADEDTLAEWVDGEVVMTSPASDRHQQIVRFLLEAMSRYAALRSLGRVLFAPFQMKLPHSGREPDVLFIATDHLGRLKKTYLDGPADLVVEIVSPESQTRDHEEKYDEYQAGGVREYWLIDPETEKAQFYQLDAAGAYQPVLPDAAGVYHSRELPGFWLRGDWLWQPIFSPVDTVLQQICGDAYARQVLDDLRRGGFLPAQDAAQ